MRRARRRGGLALLLLLAGGASGEESASAVGESVAALNLTGVKSLMMSRDKVVLLLHSTGCDRAASFEPTLASISERVPGLAYARVDVHADPKMNAGSLAVGVAVGSPALKAFFRNGPPGKRVLEYRGPPSEEAVLEWAKAVDAWDGGETLAPGWEVGRAEKAAGKEKDET